MAVNVEQASRRIAQYGLSDHRLTYFLVIFNN